MTDEKYVLDAKYTGISLAYRNEEYIADKILPRVPVDGKNFSYLKYPEEAFLNVPRTLIGPKGSPELIDVKGKYIPESIEYHSVAAEVPETDVMEAQEGSDPIGDNTLLATDALLLAREVRTAAKLQNKETYGDKVITLSGNDQMNNKSSSAVDVFYTAANKLSFRPNYAVVNQYGASYLQTHPDFLSVYTSEYTGTRGIVPLEFVAKCLGLKEIIVGRSLLNSARPGQAAQIASAWGNHIILFYQNPLAKPKAGLTFGYTAEWQNREVQRYFDGMKGAKGVHEIKAVEMTKEIICAPCGFLIENAFAASSI